MPDDRPEDEHRPVAPGEAAQEAAACEAQDADDHGALAAEAVGDRAQQQAAEPPRDEGGADERGDLDQAEVELVGQLGEHQGDQDEVEAVEQVADPGGPELLPLRACQRVVLVGCRAVMCPCPEPQIRYRICESGYQDAYNMTQVTSRPEPGVAERCTATPGERRGCAAGPRSAGRPPSSSPYGHRTEGHRRSRRGPRRSVGADRARCGRRPCGRWSRTRRSVAARKGCRAAANSAW